MSDYSDAVQALAADLPSYFAATVTELEGKMSAGQAVELAKATLHKMVDIAAEHAQFDSSLTTLLRNSMNGDN